MKQRLFAWSLTSALAGFLFGFDTIVISGVGAGDSFIAAFLIGELQGEPHKNNLRTACEVAAAARSHSGAVPDASEVVQR